MRLEDALEDIRRVGELPGKKIILRGNHDYWWSAIGRVRRALPAGMFALQNDAMALSGFLFAGSRGWTVPGADALEEDVKIYERERLRLRMSLECARRISRDLPLVVLMHYPPFIPSNPGYSDILAEFGTDTCVYGHLHGASLAYAFTGVRAGVSYHQVSCDGLDFRLKLICEN
jgi:predicted phosphohydrolase